MSVSVNRDFIFEGSNCFRIRIMLSILSGRPIMIDKIRSREEEPGLKDFEVSFLKLIVKLTNGSTFVIDETGTKLTFKPGLLFGGPIEHDCGLGRCITYYLQPLITLAPFCKQSIECTLNGITNDQYDVSVDALRQSTIPLVSKLINVWGK